MQRSTSHRSKPGDNWQELLDILSTTTFFLVARCGPTVFNVRDEDGKIFKVTISNPHTCSCRIDSRCNLCIHQVFVLLKVLKISQGHPHSYQTSLTDSEITQVLSGVCGSSAALSRMSSTTRRHCSSSKKADGIIGDSEGFVHRQELDEDIYIQCPICQDDMTRDQALTWCRRGCGNNIHAKCMQNYSQYKISNKESPGCPLCRVDWALDLLKGDCRGQASLKHSCSPVYCTGCTFPQRAKFNRCLECSQAAFSNLKKPVDFCLRCYPNIGKEHSNHHFLSCDASISDADGILWFPVANPRGVPQLIDSSILSDLQQRELSVEDYDTLLDLDKDVPDLPTQLISSLVDSVREVTSEDSCWCSGRNKTQDIDNLKVLPCKHTCHESCLRKSILGAISDDNNSLTSLRCNRPECGSKIFFCLMRCRKKKKVDTIIGGDSGTKDTGITSAPATDTEIRFHGLSVRGVAGIQGRGALRIGALHRGASSLTDLQGQGQGQGSGSTSARASPLGIEGLSLSIIGTPRDCRDPVNSVADGVVSTRDSREMKLIRNKRSRSTERSIGYSPALAADAVGDSEIASQHIYIAASGIAELSSSSSSARLCEDHEQQPKAGLAGREYQCQPTGRIMRPPRPRSMPSELGDISGLPLSLQGGLNGIAICVRPTVKSDVLMSTTAPMSSTTQGNSSIDDETESNRVPRAQKIEISRSAGSLREQRGSSNITPGILPSTAMIGITGRPLSSIQTSQSTAGMKKSPRGRISKLYAEAVAGLECGSISLPNKIGRRIRAAVGNAPRDALISEGHSPQIPFMSPDESLSLLLNINGQHQHQQISGAGIILPPSLPLRVTPSSRRGRPSPYRPISEVVQSTTHP